ncbi:hypothetical protein MRB53_009730 [Persea americana]|uniref:Uncharacterized protein n=1 Tax=Persea americana TaxID=3435 RepID=A0ACC2LQK9_PERAE|nr:hypothetical protein MRB53_009730 [Persea americana]
MRFISAPPSLDIKTIDGETKLVMRQSYSKIDDAQELQQREREKRIGNETARRKRDSSSERLDERGRDKTRDKEARCERKSGTERVRRSTIRFSIS